MTGFLSGIYASAMNSPVPPPAGPFNFPIMMANNGTLTTTNDVNMGLMCSTSTAWTTTAAFSESITPISIDLANFKIALGTAPGGAVTRTISIFDDGVSSGLDVAITGASVDGIDTGSATIAAQSNLRLNATDDGAPLNSVVSRWRIDCTSNNQVLLASSALAISTSSNRHVPLMGTAALPTISQTELVIPIAGTIKNLIVENVTSVLTSGSWAVTLYVNGAATALTCTVDNSGLIFTDAVNSVAVSAGDIVVWLFDPASPNATKSMAVGCEFECSVAGTGIIMGGTNANVSNVAVEYGWAGTGAWDATETNTQALAQAITVTDFYALINLACGTGNSRIFTMRDDAAGTSATFTISGAAAVTGSWNGSVAVAVDSLLCIEQVPVSTPDAAYAKWGLAFTTL